MNLNFKTFDLSILSNTCSINLIMKGFDHKYNVIKSIINVNNKIIAKVAIERGKTIFDTFDNLIGEKFIYSNYFPEILNRIFSMLKIYNKNENSSLKLLLVTWDSYNLKQYNEDKLLIKLYKKYLKYNITILDTDSYIKSKPIEIIKSYDWIIFGPEDSMSNRRTIYEQYFSFINDFDLFIEIFTSLTENYGLLVLDNKNQYLTNDIINKIYKL